MDGESENSVSESVFWSQLMNQKSCSRLCSKRCYILWCHFCV